MRPTQEDETKDVQTSGDSMASRYPSAPLAFQFVAPMYDWVLRRAERTESRLHAGMVGLSALTIGVVPLGKTLNADLDVHSLWLALAIAVYILGMLLGIGGLLSNKLRLVDLKALHERWLHKEEAVFQADFLYLAAADIKENLEILEKHHNALLAILAAAAVEILFLMLWMSS